MPCRPQLLAKARNGGPNRPMRTTRETVISLCSTIAFQSMNLLVSLKMLVFRAGRRVVYLPLRQYYWFEIYRLSTAEATEPTAPGEWVAGRLTHADLEASEAPIRDLANYLGAGTSAFGVEVNGQLVSALCILAGEMHDRTRGDIWPLNGGEAELGALNTVERFRGQGLAPFLIKYAACRMQECGFKTLFARIWHSNSASVAAIRKAGWEHYATVIKLDVRGFARPARFVWRRGSR